MGRRTNQTDFGELAELRLNKLLDFSKINSKQEYLDAMRKELSKSTTGSNLLPYVDELYEESSAKEKIEDKERENLEALRRAQILESKRPRKSRIADERKTHKITRRATSRTVTRWRRGRYKTMDLNNVDTKRAQININPKNIITRRDIRLRNVGIVMDKRGIKHYTDKKTGRYTSNPFKNQKV